MWVRVRVRLRLRLRLRLEAEAEAEGWSRGWAWGWAWAWAAAAGEHREEGGDRLLAAEGAAELQLYRDREEGALVRVRVRVSPTS